MGKSTISMAIFNSYFDITRPGTPGLQRSGAGAQRKHCEAAERRGAAEWPGAKGQSAAGVLRRQSFFWVLTSRKRGSLHGFEWF